MRRMAAGVRLRAFGFGAHLRVAWEFIL